jgi:prevent-host-death family protein
MKIKTTLPITSARKNIFAISAEVQKDNSYYTLTERGVPKVVLVSAERFEALLEKRGSGCQMLRDAPADKNFYGAGMQNFFSKALIIRDESRVVYLSGDEQNAKYQEESLVKAQLYVELFEKHKYPLSLIEFGRYVKVGGKESRRYIEADIIINDEKGNVRMIFEVSPFADYEKNLDTLISDLFSLSAALSWAKKPEYLVYFSRKSQNGEVKEKISVVDCRKYNSFLAWKKGGRECGKEIPQFE